MALRSLSTAALRREIARRERGAQKLVAKHTKVSKLLASLERTLADLGVGGGKRRGRPPGSKNKRGRKTARQSGRPSGSKSARGAGRKAGRKSKPSASVGASRGAGRRRPKNALGLADSLAAAVKAGSVVSPAEAIQRVKSAGYKTVSKTFNVSVSQTLANDKRFKRKSRGQYERVAAV
jgi:hypothetical protein